MAKFRSWLWTIVCSREDLQARVSYLTGTEKKKEMKTERERERKREAERKKERVGERVRIHSLYYLDSFLQQNPDWSSQQPHDFLPYSMNPGDLDFSQILRTMKILPDR